MRPEAMVLLTEGIPSIEAGLPPKSMGKAQ